MSIFFSLVYPVIIQDVIIWGSVSNCHVTNIKIAINKILRHILRVSFNENRIPLMPTSDMYRILGILKFEDVHKYFILRFIHTCFYENTRLFEEYFSHLLPDHNYETRNKRINLPAARLDIEKQATIFQCCKLINDIDECFLFPQSKQILKNGFRRHCLSKY